MGYFGETVLQNLNWFNKIENLWQKYMRLSISFEYYFEMNGFSTSTGEWMWLAIEYCIERHTHSTGSFHCTRIFRFRWIFGVNKTLVTLHHQENSSRYFNVAICIHCITSRIHEAHEIIAWIAQKHWTSRLTTNKHGSANCWSAFAFFADSTQE